jgi:hypothetical protein
MDKSTLEQACKEIIETILFCLSSAYKGTVYEIGSPPELIATRITSGEIDGDRKTISWGLPTRSDYNPPGKPWTQYMDEPGRPLEAMAWCVEKQKHWTAEDPKTDSRSVRLQVEGVEKDFHHMEPVLIRKEDLYYGNETFPGYARKFDGQMIWQDSDYVVAAVIKIHFHPYTIRIDSPETRVIRRLSRALGTELLSYQLKQQSLDAMRQLADDRLRSCNILADSMRNVIAKSGLILSLIKLELGFLRQQWEQMILQRSHLKGMKNEAVHTLDEAAKGLAENADDLGKDLIQVQDNFLELSFPPARGEKWVRMQIEEKWDELLRRRPLDENKQEEIRNAIHQLKRSLYLGKDPDIVAAYENLPESLKEEWVHLIYRDIDSLDFESLDGLIHILESPSLGLPYQNKSKKSLVRLRALAEIIGKLEEDTNLVLRQVLNGNNNDGTRTKSNWQKSEQ